MSLFPQQFLDDLRLQADIVQVVQDVVPLRRVGNAYKGLCPFHGEKTPSFTVNRERGFFHCFGCGVGGNVFKFVELHEKVSFPEAVRFLATKFGVEIPEPTGKPRDPAADAEREALLNLHEVASEFYASVLVDGNGEGGRRARRMLEGRGLTPDTVKRLRLGFAPGRDSLTGRLRATGVSPALLVKSGLVMERDGRLVDRFWNRVMIPICREGGSVIAFGGRAMDQDQVPKYLNSPETPVYTKGRTLYGLNLTRNDIRREGYAVLVEGYFDFAQALQGGVSAVIATCGTALTPAQAQLLRRFTNRAVLSFDPDAAGQVAASRSCDLMVREGFDVRVALLPNGQDPDTFVRDQGGSAYRTLIDQAKPYLEFLLDRAARRHDLADARGRLAFLQDMLEVAAGIPDAASRDYFADRVALRAGFAEEVVRQEIRRAAVARRGVPPAPRMTGASALTDAERDLLIRLLTEPDEALRAMAELEEADLEGLSARSMLRKALALCGEDPERVLGLLLERLTEEEVSLFTALPARTASPSPSADCVRTLKLKRQERERLALQRQIDSLQEQATPSSDAELNDLLARKIQDARAAHAD